MTRPKRIKIEGDYRLGDLKKMTKVQLISYVKKIQKEVMELKRQLRIAEHSKPKPEIDEQKLERIKRQWLIQSEREYESKSKVMIKNYNLLNNKLIQIGKILGHNIKTISNVVVKDVPKIQKPIHLELKKPTTIPVKVDFPNNGDITLGLCEQKLYSLLYPYSERSFTKLQMGVFTGYSFRSGSFSNSLSRLRSLGLIQGSENIQILEVKPELIGEFDFSKEEIINKLGRCEKEIYEVLLQNPDDTFGKEELAENTTTQYSAGSGSFSNAISRLNTLGLINRTDGMIRLNPELLEI